MATIYASFIDPSDAERAAGALLDHGARTEDISIVANEAYQSARAAAHQSDAAHSEGSAKSGLSTTTGADAASGAVKGTTIGVGVGVLAAALAMFVPGVGFVLGSGVLASAMAAGAATAVAGGIAGGVVGYLKDQGLDEQMVASYSTNFSAGGAILAVGVPTGKLGELDIEPIIIKYGALNVATVNSSNVTGPAADLPLVPVPLEVSSPSVDPIAIVAPAPVAVVSDHTVIDASTGEARRVVQTAEPMIDPITGMPVAVLVEDVVVEDPIRPKPELL